MSNTLVFLRSRKALTMVTVAVRHRLDREVVVD